MGSRKILPILPADRLEPLRFTGIRQALINLYVNLCIVGELEGGGNVLCVVAYLFPLIGLFCAKLAVVSASNFDISVAISHDANCGGGQCPILGEKFPVTQR